MSALKDLKEYNENVCDHVFDKTFVHEFPYKGRPTGIACPSCGQEMKDTSTMVADMSPGIHTMRCECGITADRRV